MSTLIGYGSPNKAGTHDVHGAALGPDETKAAREELKWNYGEFEIPDVAYELFGKAKDAGAKAEDQWKKTVQEYEQKYPEVLFFSVHPTLLCRQLKSILGSITCGSRVSDIRGSCVCQTTIFGYKCQDSFVVLCHVKTDHNVHSFESPRNCSCSVGEDIYDGLYPVFSSDSHQGLVCRKARNSSL